MIDVTAARLRSQQLEGPRFRHPYDLVSYMGAMQAQDYPGAKWSVGMRLQGCTAAGVEEAIAGKKVLRTWVLRGTLHFVAAEDVRWLLSLVAPGIIARTTRRYRELGLDEETFSHSNAVIREALHGGGTMTRPKIKVVLERHGISAEGQRAPYLLQRASLDGLICQTGMGRNQAVFALLEDAVPASTARRFPDGGAELARRYFMSRGPATLGDFVWWSGLPAVEAKAGLEAVRSQLAVTTIEGKTFLHDPAMQENNEISRTVHLLPPYDEYLIGYRDRGAIFGTGKEGPPPEGILSHKIVINGMVGGTWKRTVQKGAVVITKHLRVPFTGMENDAFAMVARRYGEFLGLSVEFA